jgi:hypothetical protein
MIYRSDCIPLHSIGLKTQNKAIRIDLMMVFFIIPLSMLISLIITHTDKVGNRLAQIDSFGFHQ